MSIWAVQENSTPTIKEGKEENEEEEDKGKIKGKKTTIKENPAKKQKI